VQVFCKKIIKKIILFITVLKLKRYQFLIFILNKKTKKNSCKIQ